MRGLKRFPIIALVLANAMALGLLLGAQNASAGGSDFCDEHSSGTEGCACYFGPWSPRGCHEQAARVYDCHDGNECGVMS